MTFDWREFFHSHAIEYIEKGANVSHGHLAIHCPFCGPADPSHHLSINLDGKGWRCFRSFDHRGVSPVRLVATLLQCSYDQAATITGRSLIRYEEFGQRVKNLLQVNPTENRVTTHELALPPQFRQFSAAVPACRPFIDYLLGRHIMPWRVQNLAEQFDLRYAIAGPFRYRIIFPIRFEGRLVNWTGRSIGDSPLRYKTLSTDPERARAEGVPVALRPITDCLLWYDALRKVDADTIYLVEGPFDAVNIWYLGQRRGVVATCLFTSHGSAAQIDLLHSLLPRFQRRYLLLDQGTLHLAMRFHSQLAALGVTVRQLPPGVKDPGDLRDAAFLRR